ncbi:MAG: ATP-binding protein [Alphaproteobacteria bacterium]|nr:ATP-binding protein [Rhodospirillales bacterium]MCW9045722.1 ATP-binding protein [Alphaproteobacteria bacterium]
MENQQRLGKGKKLALGALLIWTMIIAGSLFWGVHQSNQHALDLAHKEAIALFNKDQGFRLWGTKHGGVYVPISERTQPSPYLDHVEERDITTPSGKKLTLMNPAFMVRQLMEDYDDLYGIKGKITGKVVIRPGNKPDDWEENALDKLEEGAEEVLEMTDIDGTPYLRLMRPMFMKEGCLKCHGGLGIEVGELRGGVNVSVPIAPYLKVSSDAKLTLWISHLLIWGLGIGGIGLGARQVSGHILEVRKLNEALEQRVDERTKEIQHQLVERERAEILAREQGNRLRNILNSAADGIITCDDNLEIESFNAAAENIFNFKSQELVGKHISLLFPSDKTIVTGEDLLNKFQVDSHDHRGKGAETIALRQNGELFPIYVGISTVELGERKIITAIVRDLTLAKKAEETLLEAIAQAETANQAKSEFLSRMSHELRTPLNGVLGFAQLLDHNPREELTQSQKKYVDHILLAGDHLLTLINEVLDLAKIESGKLTLNISPFRPANAVQESLSMAKSMAEGHKIELIDCISECEDVGFLNADEARFRQILINLISNGIKYNKENGVVKMTCAPIEGDSDFYRFLVTDTGHGIPEDKYEFLFEPFNRLGQEGTKKDGTGIGLTITKMLVELMGGRIGVTSKVGEGSTFWVDLPIFKIDET